MSSSYQAVLAAVRDWVKDQDQQFGIWEPRNQLNEKIGGSTDSHGRLTATYCTQVLRAVNLLVSEGVLVKHGERRDAVYLTLAAEAVSQERAAQYREERAAELEIWRLRRYRLVGHHLLNISTSETDIRLSPENWDGLLACLDELAERRERAAS